MRQQAIRSINQRQAGIEPKTLRNGQTDIYNAILSSSNLPPSEKDSKRLEQEAFTILTASGDTTGRNMTTALYHLLANPAHLARLRDELRGVMMPNNSPGDDDVDVTRLEELPWFTAVLKESMRIAGMITSRAVQQAPDECLRYGEWAIPPNVSSFIILCRYVSRLATWLITPLYRLLWE